MNRECCMNRDKKRSDNWFYSALLKANISIEWVNRIIQFTDVYIYNNRFYLYPTDCFFLGEDNSCD